MLLAGGRRAEPRADAAAHRDHRAQRVAGRELAVGGGPEHVEALHPQGAAERPPAVGPPQLEVAVERGVAAVPGAGGVVGKAGKAVGAGDEALRGERAHLPRRPPARPDRELLVAPLGAGRNVDHVGNGMGDVEVEVDLLLPVEPGVEVARGVGAERRVDGVVEEEVGLVGAVAGAGVPGQAAVGDAPHPPDHRHVGDHAPEPRGEPARGELLEGEAVGVGEDLGEGRLIRHVVGHPDHRAVGRAHAPGREHVGDEQGLAPVEAVDVGPVVGVPEVEALGDPLAGVVGVAVELHAVGGEAAEVAEELQLVLDGRVAPDLRGVGHVGVAGGDEGGGVGPLHAAVGGVGVAVLEAEVGEPVGAERQADVCRRSRRRRRRRPGRCRCSARGCPRPRRPSAGSSARRRWRRSRTARRRRLSGPPPAAGRWWGWWRCPGPGRRRSPRRTRR